jgi:hypothetical protein
MKYSCLCYRDRSTISGRRGNTFITDGPFAETKEIVAASVRRAVAGRDRNQAIIRDFTQRRVSIDGVIGA